MLTTSVVTNDSSAPAQSGRRNSDETERRQASEMHEEAETEKQPSDGVENHPADSPIKPGPPVFSDVVKQPSLDTTTTSGTGQHGHRHMTTRGNRGVGHGLQRGDGSNVNTYSWRGRGNQHCNRSPHRNNARSSSSRGNGTGNNLPAASSQHARDKCACTPGQLLRSGVITRQVCLHAWPATRIRGYPVSYTHLTLPTSDLV